ncbi:MAG TPA: rod shape-determining protein RodA [Bacteroidales bacterium]|nr:rod shape-determining protein RodA [Bacteroidales bacterium]HPE57761.1 rod shape-determining protein RodA [Bacteroidales bacterium]HRX95326.1 rod shape-determining protein RodA [Bacteroidales bacterium]
MVRQKGIAQNIDWITILLYLALVLIGWVNIYAAVYDDQHRSIFDLSQNYGRQLIFIASSILLGAVILIIDAKFFSTFAWVIYLAVLVMLLGVVFLGKEIAGARSWYQIGPFSLQPSEFAKFATALALAKYLSRIDLDISKLSTRITAAVIIFTPSVIILLQPDTGSAMVFAALVLVLFREGLSGSLLILGFVVALLFILALLVNKFILIGFLASNALLVIWLFKELRKKWIWVAGILLVAAAYVFSVDYAFENVLEAHQKTRINVLLGKESDPHGAGYNINQSKIAIGSGGFAGKGFLKGTQTKFKFVPEQSTDFIFCTVGEEWGFVGSTLVIVLMMGLMIRIIILAERQRSKFSRIYGYAVASILFFHFAVNIGMTIGLFPVIGIPLPLISYGGSSLWGFTILLFIFIRQDSVKLELL